MLEPFDKLSPLNDDGTLDKLVSGPLYRFADWPTGDIPTIGAIVYTVWDKDGVFIYAGMSGRGYKPGARQQKGPRGRLNSHASGKRSGDQFCIYVHDFLVLASLHNRLHEVPTRNLSLDRETRSYIRENLSFRWVEVTTGAEAERIEGLLKKGASSAGRPLLNPDPR